MDWDKLLKQLDALIDEEMPIVSALSNCAALLWQSLSDINWVGFYLLRQDVLWLGPFQGKPACVRISLGKGVCGTAAATGEKQIVPDVHAFPGHIACDCASNAEIVLPMLKGNVILGVLDIDSPVYNRFDETDALYLAKIVERLMTHLDWSKPIF